MKKNFMYNAAVAAFAIAKAASSDALQAQQGYTLPLTVRSESVFQEELFKDSAINKKDATAISDIDQANADIATLERSLPNAKTRRPIVLKTLMQSYALLLDVYGKISDGVISGNVTPAERTAARNKILAYAKDLLKSKPSGSDQLLAQYVIITQSFLNTGRFNFPKTLLDHREMPARMRANLSFIGALNTRSYAQAANIASNFSRDARIAAYLILSKRDDSSSEGLKYAARAVRDAASLNPESKSIVLSTALANAITNKTLNWSKFPLSTTAFKNTPHYFPIVERIALAHVRLKDFTKAKALYAALATGLEGKAQTIEFDKKVISLEKSMLKQSKQTKNLETLLGKLRDKYKDDGISGADGKERVASMLLTIDREHQALVDSAVADADRNTANRPVRLQAIALTSRYISRTPDDKQKHHYQGKVARLYAIDGQHQKAVTLYMDLALNGEEAKREAYLKLAIGSQKILARWPDGSPWYLTQTQKSSKALSDLKAMYATLNERQKQTNWDTIAQLGVLELIAGEQESAFNRWQSAVEKTPSHPYAASAMIVMLERYQGDKAWAKLETIARLGLKKQVANNLAQKMLGESLFNGGKELTANNDFKNASKKLKEFCDKYPSHPMRDEGLFILAQAYRGSGEHVASLDALEEITKLYPYSKYLEPTLRLGGEAALNMALEERSIYFYQAYVTRFSKTPAYEAIADDLASLYLGRELFADAVAVLKNVVHNKTRSAALRAKFAERWLDVEERQGSLQNATFAAVQLIALSDDPALQGRAYAIQGKASLARQDMKTFAKAEASLAQLAQGNSTAQEYLGEIRFYFAIHKSKGFAKDIYNLELKDPLEALNKEYSVYLGMKSVFQQVCDGGTTSYCAPSLTQTALIADKLIPKLEDISIPETLEKSIVDRFNDRKEAIIATLSDDHRKMMESAVIRMKETKTSPDWTQQILWENSVDWNFDRISGEAGNGYIQIDSPMKSAK